jgi:hypothetical protein
MTASGTEQDMPHGQREKKLEHGVPVEHQDWNLWLDGLVEQLLARIGVNPPNLSLSHSAGTCIFIGSVQNRSVSDGIVQCRHLD